MRHSIVSAVLSTLWVASVSSAPHRQHASNRTRSSNAGFISNSGGSHKSGGEEYIVLFNSSHPAPPHVEEVLSRIQLSPDHSDVRYIYNNSAFRGFAASMKSHCIDALNSMVDVAIVEQDVKVSSQLINSRTGAPWGLQRVSSASTVLGPTKELDYTYSFDDRRLGAGVDIYVVDTGINVAHNVFNGRAKMGFSFSSDFTDQDGHGTHVAGTAAGNVIGVASGANVIGVKVLGPGGVGSAIDTLKGIDWVVNHHEERTKEPGFVGSIMSFSWALSEQSIPIDNAIRAAASEGIHVSVAAGNTGSDSCQSSPSSSGGSKGPAVTVGSVGISNAISRFSNTGTCNDVYAPGENIVSAWNTSVNTVEVLDGTSMACPHVTGIMAYWMAQNGTLARDPAAMKAFIRNSGLKNVVTGTALSGDPKILANNGETGKEVSSIMGSTTTKRSFAIAEDEKKRRAINLSGLNSLISSIFGDDNEKQHARSRLVV